MIQYTSSHIFSLEGSLVYLNLHVEVREQIVRSQIVHVQVNS